MYLPAGVWYCDNCLNVKPQDSCATPFRPGILFMSYFTEYIRRLPLLTDGTYIADVHKELTAEQTWSQRKSSDLLCKIK
jgi:hypothetical protein